MKRFMLGFIIVICLSASTQGYAAYHWVSSFGSAGGGCVLETLTLEFIAAWQLPMANAAAGDTVYLSRDLQR